MNQCQLINMKILNLVMNSDSKKRADSKNNLTIENNLVLSNENAHSVFFLKSNVKMLLLNSTSIEFDYAFTFKLEKEMSTKDIVKVFNNEKLANMTYPYIRAFITSFNSLIGLEAVSLPVMSI